MNFAGRLHRKIGSLLNAVALWPARHRLDSLAPEQRMRFSQLQAQFARRYAEISNYGWEGSMTPLWTEFNARLQQSLLPEPRADFLRDPVISGTMVVTKGGSTMNDELSYLRKRYSEEQLTRILREDPVGRPHVAVPAYLTSHNSIHHAHHIARFCEATRTDLKTLGTVVEWGGGYGNLAKIFGRMSPREHRWIIIDTPLLCALQWLYLSSVLGTQRIHVVSREGQELPESGIILLPVGLARNTAIRADLFVSTWAISESSLTAQQFVVDHNWFGAKHLLLGYQDSNPQLPNAQEIGRVARESGATVSEIPHMPGNHYAFK